MYASPGQRVEAMLHVPGVPVVSSLLTDNR